MTIKQTIFLVSKADGSFDSYDYFIPTRAFVYKKDAEKFISEQFDPCLWQIDTVILERRK